MSKRPAQPAPAPPSPAQYASTPPPVDVFRYLHVVNNQLIETTVLTVRLTVSPYPNCFWLYC
jgi:hypothetical protein